MLNQKQKLKRTSKGGSIGSPLACGPSDPRSNPAWGNFFDRRLYGCLDNLL